MTDNQRAVVTLPDLEIIEMTQAEARQCADTIKAHMAGARYLLLELYERNGWRALGYSNWRECVMGEFNLHKTHLYRQLQAAEIEKNISPIGEIGSIPESHLRPLSGLEPEQQREVWTYVTETAPQGKVTARIVQAAVDEIKMPHVSHNSGNNEWYTPPEYIEAARSVLGSIDLDPASSVKANEIIKARKFYTIEDDGLIKRWRGKVWMNPPYAADLIGKFTSKLCEHVRSGDISEAIVLVNNATEAEWFEDMAALASTVLFTFRRVKFLDDDLNPRGAPLQGQSLLYFGPNYKKFIAAFSNLAWAVNHGKH